MKQLLFIFLFTFFIDSVLAQDKPESIKKSTIFIEFLGNSVFYYSLNYDQILLNRTTWKLAARIGATYHRQKFDFFVDGAHRTRYSVPVEVSYLKGTGNHFLELGLGITYSYEGYEDYVPNEFGVLRIGYTKFQDLYTLARIGYRYQKPTGGTFFKIGITPPIINHYGLWAGLGIGYTFK